MSSHQQHHHLMSPPPSNKRQQDIRTPNELYPVVHDLSEAEYDGGGFCGETFGSFQLSDLVSPMAMPSPSIWNTLCPCTGASNNDDDNNSKNKPSNSITNEADTVATLERMKTPVKRNGHHQKKDSMATVATAADGEMLDDFVPTTSTGRQSTLSHPLQQQQTAVTPAPRRSSSNHRRRNSEVSSSSRRHLLETPSNSFDNDGDMEVLPESPTTPTRKKKGSSKTKHFRRRSRQLMNMILSRSNSMGSSTRDMSTTETSMESAMGQEVTTNGDHFEEEEEEESQEMDSNLPFADTYILTRKVFTCRYSEIWECLHKESGIRYCVKIIEYPQERDYNELNMLHFLTRYEQEERDHPLYLSKLVEIRAEETKLYAVMQLAAGGNLLSKVVQDGPMDEQRVKQLTRSILDGCLYMHTRHVVHADIQPENILLRPETDDAILSDFGSAVNLAIHDPFGSRTFSKYSAPEVLHAEQPYAEPADMWSVGCVVYFMLTGGLSPFDEDPPISKRRTMAKIARAEYSFANCHFANVSRSAKQFIANLIAVDESVRMTAKEALDHPWLRIEPAHDDHSANHGLSLFKRHPQCSTSDRSLMDSHQNHLRDSSHRSSSMGHSGRTHPESLSPARKSSKKNHHRRLSSLSKGISKLFSPNKEQPSPSQHHLACPSPPPSDLFASSTLSSTDHDDEPFVPTPRSSGRTTKEKSRSQHHRSLTK